MIFIIFCFVLPVFGEKHHPFDRIKGVMLCYPVSCICTGKTKIVTEFSAGQTSSAVRLSSPSRLERSFSMVLRKHARSPGSKAITARHSASITGKIH